MTTGSAGPTLRRRELLAGGGAGLAGLSLIGRGAWPAASAEAATAGVVLGTWSDEGFTGASESLDAIQAYLGRSLYGWRMNGDFTRPLPGASIGTAYGLGLTWSYRNNMTRMPNVTQPATWADIAAGTYDAVISQSAAQVAADSRWTAAAPFHFCFCHEPSVGVTQGLGTDADFKRAFVHVHDVFAAASALASQGGNVELCYVPLLNHFPGCPQGSKRHTASDMDPGSGAYDLIGCDFYNKVKSGGVLQYGPGDAAGLVGAVRDFAAARGTRWFIAELGVQEGAPDTKAQFVTAFFNAIEQTCPATGPGSCAAVLYSSEGYVTGKQVTYMDTSASALAAFVAVGADAYFAGRA